MDIKFNNSHLAWVETDKVSLTQLPVNIIKFARRKLAVMRAATDERSLINWKSLNYEILKGDEDGRRSIRLDDKYRMIFTLDEEINLQTITILRIEEHHK